MVGLTVIRRAGGLFRILLGARLLRRGALLVVIAIRIRKGTRPLKAAVAPIHATNRLAPIRISAIRQSAGVATEPRKKTRHINWSSKNNQEELSSMLSPSLILTLTSTNHHSAI